MSSDNDGVIDLSESYQGNIIACAVLTWLISALVVGSRMYLRGHLMKLLGAEDWVILASLFFSLAQSIGFIIEASFGLGRHSLAIPPENYVPMLEASWFTILFYASSLSLSKISVLLLYLRTLTYDWTRKILLGFLVVVIVTSAVNLILDFTACIPLDAFWDFEVQARYCHSNEVYYALTGLQIGTDFLIFLLPLPVVWSIRAPKDQKIVLSIVFSFGFFICIVSIIRIVLLANAIGGSDYSYNAVDINYWSLVEVNTAIVCASIMTLKPLWNRIFAASTRQSTGTPEEANHINLPTIGSRPSRPSRKAPPQTRQSWLSAQLAKLDKSLQTVNETQVAGDEVNLRRPETATAASRSDTELPPWPARDPAGRDRLSHNSSIITPVEHKADEGPLR
ncbi:hypothetical protein J7T55_003402 [Diaporthe amygdali]|uniref:uncharacterized protein n=1 Tax=Phomopsis amygdali TaxID=1214568 RepID=UPI0022FE8C86|nr:uncharacterized protein J7T55_003402 [Diaporthe amygdali]KAJ0116987.1 hypothetical protein J7T55_003402 [Diaporthe amygdali]